MKNLKVVTLVLILMMSLFGNVYAEEVVVIEKDYDFEGFSIIDVESACELEIVQGETYAVHVTINEKLESNLDVYLNGDVLHLGIKGMHQENDTAFTAKVTVPSLEKIESKGASIVKGHLDVSSLTLILEGASQVKMTGSADELHVNASQSSHGKLKGFNAQKATLIATSSSSIEVTVQQSVSAEAKLVSTVDVYGNPSFTKKSTDYTGKINGSSYFNSNNQTTEPTNNYGTGSQFVFPSNFFTNFNF